MEEEIIQSFNEERDELRQAAKIQIEKLQRENRTSYNKKRKIARKYKVGDLVAIRRTQFQTGQKLSRSYIGPYQVTEISDHDRYKVEKVGVHEGPGNTTSAADYIKPWVNTRDVFDSSSSGTDDSSGRPDVGLA